MAVSYRKLRYRLVDDRISLAKLMRMAGITDYAVRQISKGRDVSTEVLTKICAALHCEVQDIVDFFPDRSSEQLTEILLHELTTDGERIYSCQSNALN